MRKTRHFETFRVPTLGVDVEIRYCAADATFHAEVAGKNISSDSVAKLQGMISLAAREANEITWRPYIVVHVETHMGHGDRWTIDRPDLAPASLGMALERLEGGQLPDGRWRRRRFGHQAELDGMDPDMRGVLLRQEALGQSWTHPTETWGGKPESDRKSVFCLDYREETWAALNEIQRRLAMLHHNLRALLHQEETAVHALLGQVKPLAMLPMLNVESTEGGTDGTETL